MTAAILVRATARRATVCLMGKIIDWFRMLAKEPT
jgi:hypothetical protein